MQKHVRTFAPDDGDAVFLTKFNRLRTDGAAATGAIHPDAEDVQPSTLLDDLVGDGGGRHKQNAMDGWSDIREFGKTWRIVGGSQAGINNDHIVTALAQGAEQAAREILGLVRDADNGNAFCARKSRIVAMELINRGLLELLCEGACAVRHRNPMK